MNDYYNMSSVRKTWEFKYFAEDLFNAAVKKKEITEKKLAFWEAKKAEIEEQIKTSGVTFTPATLAERLGKNTLTNAYNNGVPRGAVDIDEEMEKNWVEAQERVAKYKIAVLEYSNWVDILEDEVGEYPLRYDDWLYFFGE
jgi:hypothetical protein